MIIDDFNKLRNWLLNWEDKLEIVTYQVSEHFNNKLVMYEVINISMDLEDERIWTSDIYGIILNRECSAFKSFTIKNIDLKFGEDYIIFKFKDGEVTVKIIN
jgi:hypothetical protein